MSTEHAKEIRNSIKEAFPPKEGWKFSIRNEHFSAINVAIMQAPLNLLINDEKNHHEVNEYHLKDHYKDHPKILSVFEKLLSIIDKGNHDRSDIMTDYFDVGWYKYLLVGRWDKPFTFKPL